MAAHRKSKQVRLNQEFSTEAVSRSSIRSRHAVECFLQRLTEAVHKTRVWWRQTDFRSGNHIYCCTQQVLSIPLEIRGKRRFCCNTGFRLTNALLAGTATSAAIKYPVALDSSSRKIQQGWRGRQTSKEILNWPLDIKMLQSPIQSSRKRDKSRWSSNTVLYSAMQGAMLAPNST